MMVALSAFVFWSASPFGFTQLPVCNEKITTTKVHSFWPLMFIEISLPYYFSSVSPLWCFHPNFHNHFIIEFKWWHCKLQGWFYQWKKSVAKAARSPNPIECNGFFKLIKIGVVVFFRSHHFFAFARQGTDWTKLPDQQQYCAKAFGRWSREIFKSANTFWQCRHLCCSIRPTHSLH